MLIAYASRRKKLLSFLFGTVSGMFAFFLVCRYGCEIGIEIPMNIFNFVGSGVLGIPFVVLLAIVCH